MAIKMNAALCNAMLDCIQTIGGASPVLKVRTGSAPTHCADSDTGTVLATATLPSTFMGSASSAAVAKSGTWLDSSADNSGDAGHFRLYTSGGTCFFQGSCGASGSGADMILSSVTLVAGGSFSVTGFTVNHGGL